MKNQNPFFVVIALLAIAFFVYAFIKGGAFNDQKPVEVDTENSQTFEDTLSDVIRVEFPEEGELITSPLLVRGEARGTWFFEASFSLILTDWDGRIIAESLATAQEEWMTEDFVAFEGVLEFEKPSFGERGFLILQKANPSGLSENDNAIEIPVFFE